MNGRGPVCIQKLRFHSVLYNDLCKKYNSWSQSKPKIFLVYELKSLKVSNLMTQKTSPPKWLKINGNKISSRSYICKVELSGRPRFTHTCWKTTVKLHNIVLSNKWEAALIYHFFFFFSFFYY